MRSRKEKIPVFIQVLYGTVLGLSFFRLAFNTRGNLRVVASTEEMITFLTSADFFKFLFFILTILILAHDWSSQKKYVKSHSDYWQHIPQILALFCLAQMFVSLETFNLKYWYAAFCGYTLSALLNFFLKHKGNSPAENAIHCLRFLIQLFLAEIFFFVIPSDFIWSYYLIALSVTAYILVFIWWLARILILYFKLKDIPDEPIKP